MYTQNNKLHILLTFCTHVYSYVFSIMSPIGSCVRTFLKKSSILELRLTKGCENGCNTYFGCPITSHKVQASRPKNNTVVQNQSTTSYFFQFHHKNRLLTMLLGCTSNLGLQSINPISNRLCNGLHMINWCFS